jgi:hypothetical protein
MRILFVAAPLPSHLLPMIPLAGVPGRRARRARGGR